MEFHRAPGDTLAADWAALLGPFGAPANACRTVFEQLVNAYGSTGRFYHTLDHVRDVLDKVNALKDLAKDLAAVRLAAWFHDVVYDSRAADNEEKSVAFAAEALGSLKLPESVIRATGALIQLTKTHQARSEDVDGHILLDADLAILGAPQAEYERYAAAIRREYAWVPAEEYRTGRRQVLERFLQRERIYLTEPLFQALETRARANLRRELAVLA